MKETKGLSTEEKKYLYRSKMGRPGKLDDYENIGETRVQQSSGTAIGSRTDTGV